MKYKSHSFPSSDQVGAPLQRCGHLGSYGDHTHTPPRSIYSVPGIAINHSNRSHGHTHLQTNMVASRLFKNYLFYSKLYCGSALPVCAKTTMQCRCTEFLIKKKYHFYFWATFQSLVLHMWGVQSLSGLSKLPFCSVKVCMFQQHCSQPFTVILLLGDLSWGARLTLQYTAFTNFRL